MTCKWGCPNDCRTYGQHLRNKGIGFNGCFPTRSAGAGRGDAMAQRAWDRELDYYQSARSQGIQPAGTSTAQIEAAERYSNDVGVAFDASDPYKHVSEALKD